jgi:hydroxypyruvate isomerase
MFQDMGFIERFDAAAHAGFKGVEFLFPYDHPPETIAERLRRNNLSLALFSTAAGDWAGGERGLAALPAGRENME